MRSVCCCIWAPLRILPNQWFRTKLGVKLQRARRTLVRRLEFSHIYIHLSFFFPSNFPARTSFELCIIKGDLVRDWIAPVEREDNQYWLAEFPSIFEQTILCADLAMFGVVEECSATEAFIAKEREATGIIHCEWVFVHAVFPLFLRRILWGPALLPFHF